MSQARLARGYTGRNKIIKFEVIMVMHDCFSKGRKRNGYVGIQTVPGVTGGVATIATAHTTISTRRKIHSRNK